MLPIYAQLILTVCFANYVYYHMIKLNSRKQSRDIRRLNWGRQVGMRQLPWYVSWLLQAAVIYYIMITSTDVYQAAIMGAVIGSAMHGYKQLWNYAMLKKFNLNYALRDFAWGVISMTAIAALFKLITSNDSRGDSGYSNDYDYHRDEPSDRHGSYGHRDRGNDYRQEGGDRPIVYQDYRNYDDYSMDNEIDLV